VILGLFSGEIFNFNNLQVWEIELKVQIKLEGEVQKNVEIVITEPVLPWRLELLSLEANFTNIKLALSHCIYEC